MTLDAVAPLDYLVNLVTALSGMQTVIKGIPLGIKDANVAAIVALGQRTIDDKTIGQVQRELSYVVAFGVRTTTEDSIESAEYTIAGLEDAFTRAWLADRSLGGTVDSSRTEDRSNDSEYRSFLAAEFRMRFYHVVVSQREQF